MFTLVKSANTTRLLRLLMMPPRSVLSATDHRHDEVKLEETKETKASPVVACGIKVDAVSQFGGPCLKMLPIASMPYL